MLTSTVKPGFPFLIVLDLSYGRLTIQQDGGYIDVMKKHGFRPDVHWFPINEGVLSSDRRRIEEELGGVVHMYRPQREGNAPCLC